MPSRLERFIGVFEFSIRVARMRGEHPVPLTLQEFRKIQQKVQDLRKNNEVLKTEIEENRLIIALDDVEIFERQKAACLLFTVIDRDAADAVYRDFKNYSEKVYRKTPDEGGAASAHLLISLDAEANVFRYRAGLEDIEGVSRSRIVPFLQEVIRVNCGQVTAIVDEEKHTGDPVIELDAIHKDKLGDAAGRPVSVQLVQLHRRKRLDGSGDERYRESKKTIEFVIDQKRPLTESLGALFDIRHHQETSFSDYPLMRIRWKRPDERTQTLHVDSLADDLMQRAFTRLEVVKGFKEDLVGATKKIRTDLATEMMRVIDK
jgi:hypothetical protein